MAGFDSNDFTVMDSYDGDFIEEKPRTAPDVCSLDTVEGEITVEKHHSVEFSEKTADNSLSSEIAEKRTEIFETVAIEKNLVAEEKTSTVNEEIIVESQLIVTKCSNVDIFLEEVHANVVENTKEVAEKVVKDDSDWEIISSVDHLDRAVNDENKSSVENSEWTVEMSAGVEESVGTTVRNFVKIVSKKEQVVAENNSSVGNLESEDIVSTGKHMEHVIKDSSTELGENGSNRVQIADKINDIASKEDSEPTDNNSNPKNSDCKIVTEKVIEKYEENVVKEWKVYLAESEETVENVVDTAIGKNEEAAKNDHTVGNLNCESIPNVKKSEHKVVNEVCVKSASKEDPDHVQNNLKLSNTDSENILIVQKSRESVVVEDLAVEAAVDRGDATQKVVEFAWKEDPKTVENISNAINVDGKIVQNIEKPKEKDLTGNEVNSGGVDEKVVQIYSNEPVDNNSNTDGFDGQVITEKIIETSEQNATEEFSKELADDGGDIVDKFVEAASKKDPESVDCSVNDLIDENVVQQPGENVIDETSVELAENGGDVAENVPEIASKENLESVDDNHNANHFGNAVITEKLIETTEQNVIEEFSIEFAEKGGKIVHEIVQIASKENQEPVDTLDKKVIAENIIERSEDYIVDEINVERAEKRFGMMENVVQIASKEDTEAVESNSNVENLDSENIPKVDKSEGYIVDEMSVELPESKVEIVETVFEIASKENQEAVENIPHVDNFDCKNIPNVEKSKDYIVDEMNLELPENEGEIIENVVEIASKQNENVDHENTPNIEESEGYVFDDMSVELPENGGEIVKNVVERASKDDPKAVENNPNADNLVHENIPNVEKSEGYIVDDMSVELPENGGEIVKNVVERASKDDPKAVENNPNANSLVHENISNVEKSEGYFVDDMSVELPENRGEIDENLLEIASQELNNAKNVDFIDNTVVNNGVESAVHAAANNMLSDKSDMELCEGNNFEHSEQWDESLLQAKHPANAKNDENNETKEQVHKEICMQNAKSDSQNNDEIESELSLVKINCEVENLAARATSLDDQGLTDEIPNSVVSSDFITDDNVIVEQEKFDTSAPEESPKHEHSINVVIGEGLEAKSEESVTLKAEQSKTELVGEITELFVHENIDITENNSAQVVTVCEQQDIVNTLVETPANCTAKEFAVETKMDVQIATNTQISQEFSQTETATIANGNDETIIETVTTTSTLLTKESDGESSEVVHEEVSVVRHEKAETKASSEETNHKEIEVNGPVVEIPDTVAVQQVAMEIKSEKTTITTEAKSTDPPAPSNDVTHSSDVTEVKTEEVTNKRHSMNFFTPTPFKLRTGFTKVEAPTSKRASTPTTEPAKEAEPPAAAPCEETPAATEESPAPTASVEVAAPTEETPAPVAETQAPAEETPAPVKEAPAPAEETQTPAAETPPPVLETPASIEEPPAPTEGTSTPGEESPAPGEEVPPPVAETAHEEQAPAPVAETPTPAEEAPAAAEETPAPAEETPAPAEEIPAPAEETPAPAEETPASAVETTSPAVETPAPAEETPAPAEETTAPVVETTTLAEETPASEDETPAPAEEIPAPAEETTAPAVETTTPAEETPAEETTAPAEKRPRTRVQ
eukprot:Seg3489.1 transcript_id=Seg3489.1/GoldUCD/mRNA.D3Y31 product=Zonadhesin protein_id=Seg3489.1/GoldUCD/D3Y31